MAKMWLKPLCRGKKCWYSKYDWISLCGELMRWQGNVIVSVSDSRTQTSLCTAYNVFIYLFFMTYINQFLWLCSIVLKDFYMTFLVAFPFIEYYTGMLFFENVSKLSFLFYSFSIFFNRRVCILIMAKFCVLISIME